MLSLSERHKFELHNGNVVSDPYTHRQVVLGPTALRVFQLWIGAPDRENLVKTISSRLFVPAAKAGTLVDELEASLVQGPHCDGSILPGKDHAVLEPTAACNGQCPHCYHGERSSRWSDEQELQVLDNLGAAGIKSVSITGGEVFSAHFFHRMFEFTRRLRDRGITVASVSTNATFISEEVRDRVLAEFDRKTVFRISMDALDSDLLDRVRPGYRRLEDPYFPIRDLDAAGFPLVFTTNLWTQPVDDILQIGEYLRQFDNVKHWNIRLAVPVHYGAGETARSGARKRQVFELRPRPDLPLRFFPALLRRHAEEPYPFDMRLGNYLATSTLRQPHTLRALGAGHPCREDQRLITFKADGGVTQCPILTELAPQLRMAIDERGPVIDRDYADRLPLASLDTADMPCTGCRLKAVCGGGCRLYGLAFEERLDGCDLPAKQFLEWQLADPDGILQSHWPDYHARLKRIVESTESELAGRS